MVRPLLKVADRDEISMADNFTAKNDRKKRRNDRTIVLVIRFSSIIANSWYLSGFQSYQRLKLGIFVYKMCQDWKKWISIIPIYTPEKQTWSSCRSGAGKRLEMSPLVGLWVHIAATIVPHPFAGLSPLRLCAPYLCIPSSSQYSAPR